MVIGPCISLESYEVDENFYDNFINKDQSAREFFRKTQTQKKYVFNLPLYAYNIGIENGIDKNNVEIINLDTYKNEDLFFSHRRSTHRNEGKGLQLSCITIKAKE
jgi:copper oxidase (laccase) domain-containing protein